jgi:hypothetical protein
MIRSSRIRILSFYPSRISDPQHCTSENIRLILYCDDPQQATSNLYTIDQVQTGYYDPSAPQFAYLPQQPGGFTDHPPPKYEDINPKKND